MTADRAADPRLGAFLVETRSVVDAGLDRWLPPVNALPQSLHEAMRYSALAPGKRIRPALCLAVGRLLGADDEALLPSACALEMIHAFSLVHDDLPAMDDDALRRGRPTNHIKFGEATAILAGDALSALAFEIVARETPDASCVPALIIELGRSVGTEGMIGGQVLDMEGETRDPDLALVEQIHLRKTAALIRAACAMGALVAGAAPDVLAAMSRYGELTGLAFQVQDDVLDETATAGELGKAAGKDAARGKQTYPRCAGLEESRRLATSMTEEAVHSVRTWDRDGTLEMLARFVVSRSA